MKKWMKILLCNFLFVVLIVEFSNAQCSICTKTAQQLGEEPAKGLNQGILYLMLSPLAIAGYIGFRWWKREKEVLLDEAKVIN